MATLYCMRVLSRVLLAVDLVYQIYSLACGKYILLRVVIRVLEKKMVFLFSFLARTERMLTNY
jgi:hypothetical protein